MTTERPKRLVRNPFDNLSMVVGCFWPSSSHSGFYEFKYVASEGTAWVHGSTYSTERRNGIWPGPTHGPLNASHDPAPLNCQNLRILINGLERQAWFKPSLQAARSRGQLAKGWPYLRRSGEVGQGDRHGLAGAPGNRNLKCPIT